MVAPPVVAPCVVAPPVAVPPPPAVSQPVEKSELLLPMPMLVKNESHSIQLSDGGNGSDDTNAEMGFNNDDDMENGGKIPFKKIFQKRKKSSGAYTNPLHM